MTGWSVMLRGIRYRSGRSLVVLLIAAFATLAAVLIPAYGRAAAQSVLTDGMRSAPLTAASVTISAEGSAAGAAGGAFDPASSRSAEAKALADTAFRRAPNLAAVLDRPISPVETDSQVALASGAKFGARLAWRLGSCGQLSVSGSCAIDAEQVVISERSAKEAGIKLGDFVTVRAAPAATGRASAWRSSGSTPRATPTTSTGATTATSRTPRCPATVACRAWTRCSPARRTTSGCPACRHLGR